MCLSNVRGSLGRLGHHGIVGNLGNVQQNQTYNMLIHYMLTINIANQHCQGGRVKTWRLSWRIAEGCHIANFCPRAR